LVRVFISEIVRNQALPASDAITTARMSKCDLNKKYKGRIHYIK
jgi:hypothetical protein